jgi:RimJ/RimL family protein N-acetyltransferase
VLRVAEYGGDEELLEGIWIAGPLPDSDLSSWADNVITQALAGWTDSGGVHGGGLVIDEEESFVGMIYLTPSGNNGIEISYGIAPPARGRGIATRALRLITDWAVTYGAFASVELHIAENHAASRRVAEKAGFRLQKRSEIYVENTGETYIDVLYSFAPITDG